jgi:hypothetical protein
VSTLMYTAQSPAVWVGVVALTFAVGTTLWRPSPLGFAFIGLVLVVLAACIGAHVALASYVRRRSAAARAKREFMNATAMYVFHRVWRDNPDITEEDTRAVVLRSVDQALGMGETPGEEEAKNRFISDVKEYVAMLRTIGELNAEEATRRAVEEALREISRAQRRQRGL